jgi:NADP-dependent 3-hydroxy acid dehydrogenase YdfG
MAKYDGRAAIITGASGGLGRAIALRLAERGMALWLAGRTRSDLEDVAASAVAAGSPAAHAVELDLQQDGALAALVQEVGKLHGYLFALVNNAGLMHPEPILDGQPDRWRAMFDVNVLAPLQGCRAAIEVMRGHGKPGHLVNISSLASRINAGGVYGATKVAQEMISRSLRQELEHDDIRVTSIVPGGFVSKLGRYFEPAVVQKLISNASAKGVDLTATGNRAFGDPVHIANAVEYVLDQPIEINLQEIIIQPPVSISY